MQVVKSTSDICLALSLVVKPIIFVPTMGNLHDGHIALARYAKSYGGKDNFVVASIFVNPQQFSANEDLSTYPRTLESDIEKLKAIGVDVVFTPNVNDIYPKAPLVHFDVPSLTNCLCGKSRPHFFNGVLQALHRLFSIVKPNVVILGEKDYQQFIVVKAFAEDTFQNVEVISHPIVREQNGLAMSSRNEYLNLEEKQKASIIFKTIFQISNHSISIEEGSIILVKNGLAIDYLEERWGRIFVACYLKGVRLIDNVSIR